MTVTIRRHENKDLGPISIANITKGSGAEQNQKALLASVNAVMVDGVHRRQSLLNISNMSTDEVLPKWLNEPLRVHIILRKDGADLCDTEILQIGSHRNQVTSTVRPFETLEDHIFAVMSYLQSFAGEGRISVEEIRPSNVASQMSTVDLIPGMRPDTYRRYARIAKVFLKHPRAFEKLKSLNPEIAPKIGAVHLDNGILLSIDEAGFSLFLDSLNAYVRNPASSGSFQPTTFYQNAKGLYETCRRAFNIHGVSRQMSFERFLSTEIPHTKTKRITISTLFINQMKLFSDRTKQDREKMVSRANRFESRINSFFQPNEPKETLREDPSMGEKGIRSEASRQESNEPLATPSRGSSEQLVRRKSSRTRNPPTNLAAGPTRSEQRKRKRSSARSSKTRRIRRRLESSQDSESEDLMDGQGYRIPEDHKDIGPFDDSVPSLLPHGVKDADVYKGEIDPWWQSAVSLPPSKVEEILAEVTSKEGNIHHTPWLRDLHIPCEHRAHLYADFESLQYLHRLAWLLACKASLTKYKALAPTLSAFLPDKWEDALNGYKIGLGSDIFAKFKEDLNQKGFCTLEGFADDAAVPEAIRSNLKQSPSRSNVSISDLFSHYQQTFPGEDKLKTEETWSKWAPITNVGVDAQDKSNREAGKSRFSTTRMLLMEETEKSSSTVWASIRRAYLDVWVCQLAALIGIHNHRGQKFWVPKTGGRFLLTGKGCPRQAAHNDFQVPHKSEEHKSPGFFCIVSADHGFPIWVSEYSHSFVFKTVSDLRHIGPRLNVRKVIVPPNSVFFGHGYLTHAGAGFESRICDTTTIRYHLYLIPDDRNLPDSIFYAFPVPPKFEDEESVKSVKAKVQIGGPKRSSRYVEDSDTEESVDQDDDVLFNNIGDASESSD